MAFGPPEYEGSPLHGMDFSWLAVDRDGHVAWLVTFGSAVLPPWVEKDADAFDNVESSLRRLPEQGAASSSETSRYIQEWVEAARRGVFGYDWEVHSGPYRIVATPKAPLEVSGLPSALASLARRTRFEHLCFQESPRLQVSDIVACKSGS